MLSTTENYRAFYPMGLFEFLSQLFQRGDPAATSAAIALIVSLVAFIGTILNALVLLLNARRTLYVNAVTSERTKWINSLRGNIASFSGKLRTLSYRIDRITQPERDAAVAEINDLISLIHLQLNPFGRIEGNIRQILDRMPHLAEKANGEDLRRNDNLLIAHCQWLLKQEWEKVKYEARGILCRVALRVKSKWYLCQYSRFCRTEKGRL